MKGYLGRMTRFLPALASLAIACRESRGARQRGAVVALEGWRAGGPHAPHGDHAGRRRSTIAAVTAITPEPGEMLIVSPQGVGQFELRGRLRVRAPQ